MSLSHEIRYFLKQTQINFRNERALWLGFTMQAIGMIISNMSFFIIWIFFSKTIGIVNGWGPLQTFGMLSISIFIYGLSHSIFGSVWSWSDKVPTGAFDSLLTKPKNLYLRVISTHCSVSAFGDLIQGLAGMIIYIILTKEPFSHTVWLLIMLVPAAFIHVAFLITVMCTIFWVPQSTELGRSLGNLLLLPSTQPISLLDGILRWIYLFMFPALVVAGLPIEMFTTPDPAKLALSYGITIGWVWFSYIVFTRSVRRYESGNSIGN